MSKNSTIMKGVVVALTAVIAIMSVLLITEIGTLKQNEKELAAEANKVVKLETEIKSLKNSMESLTGENFILKNILTEEEGKNEDIKNWFGEEEYDAMNVAKEITEITPLDFDTAMVIVHYADMLDLKVSLLLSLIELESNFGQYEVGAADDRGYMQIIPSTEKWLATSFGSQIGLEYNPDRIFEPEYNIGLGAIYLSLLKDAYGNNYNRILSEYNRGPYNLARYFEQNNTYETTYSKLILKKETKYLVLND